MTDKTRYVSKDALFPVATANFKAKEMIKDLQLAQQALRIEVLNMYVQWGLPPDASVDLDTGYITYIEEKDSVPPEEKK